MPADLDTSKRPYNAPQRDAAAGQTRLAIVAAAKDAFEARGWSGATLGLIAQEADVSLKTVEAVFGTKPALLKATVAYAIRGDAEPIPIRQRQVSTDMESAPDALTMLDLHAAHLRRVHAGSAQLAWVVEQAAKGDKRVAALWDEMNENRRDGVRWATATLLSKSGTSHLDPDTVASVFWVSLDWGTYRLLTEHAGLDADGYERWIVDYYRHMFELRGSRRR